MKLFFVRYEINGNERFIIKVIIEESAVKTVILKYKNIPSIFMRRNGFTNGATYEEIIEMSVKCKKLNTIGIKAVNMRKDASKWS